MRTSDPTISSKGTSSPGSRDRISWTSAMDRTRRSASRSASWPLPGSSATGLEPEQRRDRLQVVLDPVVHLADGGVLREQEPVEAAEVGDVAQQHHGPRDRVLLEQGRALDEDDDVGPALDLLGDGATRRRRAQSTAASSIPSSERRRPSTTSLTPMRCRALMALGDA